MEKVLRRQERVEAVTNDQGWEGDKLPKPNLAATCAARRMFLTEEEVEATRPSREGMHAACGGNKTAVDALCFAVLLRTSLRYVV